MCRTYLEEKRRVKDTRNSEKRIRTTSERTFRARRASGVARIGEAEAGEWRLKKEVTVRAPQLFVCSNTARRPSKASLFGRHVISFSSFSLFHADAALRRSLVLRH